MTAARVALPLVLVAALLPGLAEACPSCLSSPYGDRSYTWAQAGLLLMPFLVAMVVGAILAWSFRWRPRLPSMVARVWNRTAHLKETT
jgi:hypothetical protein